MPPLNESLDLYQKPFEGTWLRENKIVIGIDVGTTQSGVAFAYLKKGMCGMSVFSLA
jgi:hypothetical protein